MPNLPILSKNLPEKIRLLIRGALSLEQQHWHSIVGVATYAAHKAP